MQYSLPTLSKHYLVSTLCLILLDRYQGHLHFLLHGSFYHCYEIRTIVVWQKQNSTFRKVKNFLGVGAAPCHPDHPAHHPHHSDRQCVHGDHHWPFKNIHNHHPVRCKLDLWIIWYPIIQKYPKTIWYSKSSNVRKSKAIRQSVRIHSSTNI